MSFRFLLASAGRLLECQRKAPMFARIKRVGSYAYLQLVRTERQEGRPRQRVLATLGRVEALQIGGELDGLLRSLSQYGMAVVVGEPTIAVALCVPSEFADWTPGCLLSCGWGWGANKAGLVGLPPPADGDAPHPAATASSYGGAALVPANA